MTNIEHTLRVCGLLCYVTDRHTMTNIEHMLRVCGLLCYVTDRQTDITLHSNHQPAGLLYRVYCRTELTRSIHHSRLTLLYHRVKTVMRYDWVMQIMLGTIERSSDRLILAEMMKN